jgi:hypothetical protein
MSNSSAQLDYLTISSDNIITLDSDYDVTSDTITINNTGSSSTNTSYYTGSFGGTSIGTITLTTTGTGYTIGGLSGAGSTSEFIWKGPEEFVDSFPDYNRVQKMCSEYPGLKIAYEKFVTTYKLVKDDYDTPKDQRPKP